jgi:hypothetical protein
MDNLTLAFCCEACLKKMSFKKEAKNKELLFREEISTDPGLERPGI